MGSFVRTRASWFVAYSFPSPTASHQFITAHAYLSTEDQASRCVFALALASSQPFLASTLRSQRDARPNGSMPWSLSRPTRTRRIGKGEKARDNSALEACILQLSHNYRICTPTTRRFPDNCLTVNGSIAANVNCKFAYLFTQ
ncbi:hypothetical protein FA95DRAFT_1556215 [Auriscalpium vulgare]|uniref:Uncharacterized protein n=1 Tax=Auriscalpium vulgare TaxID=40419 RepID=A0ACB8S231_9AGAM|nr:hypothetical protein FA95DRAFT_1556215 [Auriscalpium vulgare]